MQRVFSVPKFLLEEDFSIYVFPKFSHFSLTCLKKSPFLTKVSRELHDTF